MKPKIGNAKDHSKELSPYGDSLPSQDGIIEIVVQGYFQRHWLGRAREQVTVIVFATYQRCGIGSASSGVREEGGDSNTLKDKAFVAKAAVGHAYKPLTGYILHLSAHCTVKGWGQRMGSMVMREH